MSQEWKQSANTPFNVRLSEEVEVSVGVISGESVNDWRSQVALSARNMGPAPQWNPQHEPALVCLLGPVACSRGVKCIRVTLADALPQRMSGVATSVLKPRTQDFVEVVLAIARHIEERLAQVEDALHA